MIRIVSLLAMLVALGRAAARRDRVRRAAAQGAGHGQLGDIVRIGDLVENAGAAADVAGVPRARSRPDRRRAGRAHRRGAARPTT